MKTLKAINPATVAMVLLGSIAVLGIAYAIIQVVIGNYSNTVHL